MPRPINHSRDAELWYHNTIIRLRNNEVFRHITGISASPEGRAYQYGGVTLPTLATVPERVSASQFNNFFRERSFSNDAFVASERRIVLATRLYYLEDLGNFIKVTYTDRHTYRRSMSLQSVAVQIATPAELATSFWNSISQQPRSVVIEDGTGSFFVELPSHWFLSDITQSEISPTRGLLVRSVLNSRSAPTFPDLQRAARQSSSLRSSSTSPLADYLRTQLQSRFPNLREEQVGGLRAYLGTVGYQAILLNSMNLPHFTISARDMLTTHPVHTAGLVEGNVLYLPLHPYLSPNHLLQCPVPYGVLIDSSGVGLGYVESSESRPVSRYLEMLTSSRSAA